MLAAPSRVLAASGVSGTSRKRRVAAVVTLVIWYQPSLSQHPDTPQTDEWLYFIPGLAVNKATSGATAQLGLTYYFYPKGSTQLSVGFISSANAGSTWTTTPTIVSGMSSTWATTSQGRMVGDYISTSYGSDGLAHGIFGAAYALTSGTSCSSVLDNCKAPIDTFTPGLASGSASSANDQVLFTGNGGTNAQSLWNVVDNNGSKHRD
jgi:hypothetical protein